MLAAGFLLTIAFAGYVILDQDSTTDGLADWEVLDVCLDDHDGAISHIHASISVTISGNQIAVPSNTGIQDEMCSNGMRGIHTHDDTGRLHIETPGAMDAPVGAFFQIGGEDFDETHILNKEANDVNEVVMFVNGEQNYDYENYVMHDGDVIEIEYRGK